MPARKQQLLKSSKQQSHGQTFSPARRSEKMAGTRVGVMIDWRAGGAMATGKKPRLINSVRDGR